MTAPLDIGLEQTDAGLGYGQDDIFDLADAERASRRTSYPRTVDTDEEGEELGESSQVNGLDDVVVDTDEDQNGRVQALGDDLDGLYESYKERLAERDTKFRVREARQNDKRREDWTGIGKGETHDETEEEDEGGGWDEMEHLKAKDDDSDSPTDTEDETSPQSTKRKRPDQRDAPQKKARILTPLGEPQIVSSAEKNTMVWFGQDVFKGLDQPSEDEKECDSSKQSQEDEDEVSPCFVPSSPVLIIYQYSDLDLHDGLEIVPLESDEADMWDASNENEDDLKSSQIKGNRVS